VARAELQKFRRRRKATYRPFVEVLEDRSLLSTLVVNSTGDAGGTCPGASCTLRQAIATAVSGDTIEFAAGITTIGLTSGQLNVFDKNLTINGPGANLLTVQRSDAIGTPDFRIFEISGPVNVTISGLTIANGKAPDLGGGGIYISGGISKPKVTLTITNTTISGNSALYPGGGGIHNYDGTLIITNSTISGNQGDGFGGGILNSGGLDGGATVNITNSTLTGNLGGGGGGGGVYNNGGTVTITNSTISGNEGPGGGGGISNSNDTDNMTSGTVTIANTTISSNSGSFSQGGGVYNHSGRLTITNSTISGNVAKTSGGGIFNEVGGTATITNSTISGNAAEGGNGGGIQSRSAAGTVNISSTIIAKNTAPSGPDVYGSFASQGFNLIGKTDASSGFTAATDQTGTVALPKDPKLGPLQDNGGRTFTHALLPDSTAIDKGTSNGSTTDQRGFARPVDSPTIANASAGDGSDIGAYEVQADLLPGCNTINRIVNNNNDSGTDSLRAVIANVCAGSTITFSANARGAINLTSGELVIDKTLTINGPSANLLSVQRSASAGNFRIFHITGNFNVAISGLTIANGNVPDFGGGIFNENSTLSLANVTISGNTAAFGAGIYTARAATITDSTISGNTVSSNIGPGSGGGGIYNQGTLSLAGSTIFGNRAQIAGGGGYGGGILTNVGTVDIRNSTISGNSADFGGGIRTTVLVTTNLKNTIIALNTSASGPDISGPLISQGFNLIGNSSGASISPAQFSDQIGASGSPIDPLLDMLMDNGGPTQTLALLSGSPAIGAGDPSLANTADQRGYNRGTPVDMGAFQTFIPNTAPSCTIGPPQNTTDETGPQSVPVWVTNCAANDPGQTVVLLSIVVDKPELFTTLPAVDASGRLTYDPAPNVRGTATITVTVKDDGGTVSGGLDTSSTMRSFNVAKPHPWHNAARSLDVSNDTHITAGDALDIINYINARFPVAVTANAQIGKPFGFLDVNGDDNVAPNDVLDVINAINAGQGGEGESQAPQPTGFEPVAGDLLALLASDPVIQATRRRR
jgi:CSLREA domain-containing protein